MAIARIMPEFASATHLDAPMSSEAVFNLTRSGELIKGRVTTEIGTGSIDLGTSAAAAIRIDHGRIALAFERRVF